MSSHTRSTQAAPTDPPIEEQGNALDEQLSSLLQPIHRSFLSLCSRVDKLEERVAMLSDTVHEHMQRSNDSRSSWKGLLTERMCACLMNLVPRSDIVASAEVPQSFQNYHTVMKWLNSDDGTEVLALIELIPAPRHRPSPTMVADKCGKHWNAFARSCCDGVKGIVEVLHDNRDKLPACLEGIDCADERLLEHGEALLGVLHATLCGDASRRDRQATALLAYLLYDGKDVHVDNLQHLMHVCQSFSILYFLKYGKTVPYCLKTCRMPIFCSWMCGACANQATCIQALVLISQAHTVGTGEVLKKSLPNFRPVSCAKHRKPYQ